MTDDIEGLVQACGASNGFHVGRSTVVEWTHKTFGQLGHASLVWGDSWIHWEGLWAERLGGGILVKFAQALPDYFRRHGMQRLTAIGLSDQAWQWLEPIGFQPVKKAPEWLTTEWLEEVGLPLYELNNAPDELFVLYLTPHPCRMDEYAAWKQGDSSEPPWHQSVAQRKKLD